ITVLSAFGNETCGDGTGFIDLTVAGSTDLSYAWLPGGETTEDLSGLAAGTYDVAVTNNNSGCVHNESITIVNDEVIDLTLTAVVTDESCSDASGAIDLTVSGSTDLAFGWSSGASDEDISGLNAGDYTVTVINNTSGCVAEETFTVSNTTSGMLVSVQPTAENCGNADGSIDVTVTGGVGPFSYSWLPAGETTEDLSGLTAGDYTVTVTDDNDGCQFTETVTILSEGDFNLDLLSVTNESCAGNDGEIDMDISGAGTLGATILWTPNAETTEDITGLSAGTYGITVTNTAGCTMTLDVVVDFDNDITVLSAFGNETCGDGTGFIDLTVAGSTDLSYAWLPGGETTEDLSGL
ncbi:MAG: hypothetical protein GY893_08440, partial [bacterium]|nr:hypothetical protein [bacterium]